MLLKLNFHHLWTSYLLNNIKQHQTTSCIVKMVFAFICLFSTVEKTLFLNLIFVCCSSKGISIFSGLKLEIVFLLVAFPCSISTSSKAIFIRLLGKQKAKFFNQQVEKVRQSLDLTLLIISVSS